MIICIHINNSIYIYIKMNWVLGSVRELQEELGCSWDHFAVYIYEILKNKEKFKIKRKVLFF